MSTQAMTWAIEQRTGGPSAKTVLWSIANYANQHWCAWPSQQLIVNESEQSPDSVQRRIPDLEALGLLRRIPLRFSGRKTVDFIVLAPSALFKASLEDIEPYLPRGCVVDPKWAALHAAANRGNAETRTLSNPESPTLPQTLPQPAAHAAALVRQHEPVVEPLEPLRENVRTRREGEQAARPGLTFQLPDDGEAEKRFADLVARWDPPGAVGSIQRAKGLFLDLSEADQVAALEALPRVRHGWKLAKRTNVIAVATYIENREWERFPKPAKADGTPEVEKAPIAAFSRGSWALFRRALENARSVDVPLGWIRKGVTVPLATAPSQAEEMALCAVGVGSPEFMAWADYGERLGFVLPKPDAAEFVFLPSLTPPPLSLRWKAYRLPGLSQVRIRSPRWWWRLYSEGAPIADLLSKGRRTEGVDQVEMGPLPLAREVNAMVEIHMLTDQWEAWATWFAVVGAHLEMWPHKVIYAPSEYPPAAMSKVRQKENAA